MEEVRGKTLRKFLILRRAMVTLSVYISDLDVKASSDDIYLEGTCYWRRWKYVLRFRCDRLLKKLVQELLRLEPAVLGEKIKLDHIKALIIALYAPATSITPELRMQIKKHAGLFKDRSLRNKCISAKILSGKKRQKPSVSQLPTSELNC
ncbi:MAG: hypothetical protein QXJ86_06780 [Nitrososphaerales archaeon]